MVMSKSGGVKKSPKKMSSKKSNENKRTFKIVEVDGKQMVMSRLTGKDHSSAARRAIKSICNKFSKNSKKCKHTFSLQETTNGSDKKIKTFSGERVKTKLDKPKKIRDYVVEYDVKTTIQLIHSK
jgi:hypothetical protein